MRWVLLALRRSHPRTYPAFVDAFVLGSNPSIDRSLAELCRSDDPALVEVALEAMTRRGRPDMASVVLLLMRPSASLAAKAIHLATRLSGPSALPLLVKSLDSADPVIAANAAAALVTLGDPRGPKHLRALLQRQRQDDSQTLEARRVALEAVCLLGSPFDRNLVATEASLSPELLHWLGWHGHPDHLPVLFEAARRAASSGTLPECDRIVSALERLCGGSAPRPGGFGPSEFDERLTAYIKTFEERRPLGGERLRLGDLWSPNVILTELSARNTKQGVRPVLSRELAMVTRGAVFFDPAGWIVSQERALASAREVLSRQT